MLNKEKFASGEKNKNGRRDFIKKSSLITLGTIAVSGISKNIFAASPSQFTLPPLPYDYAALEPHIDAMTMQIHHDKHHQAYVDKLNDAVKTANIGDASLENILAAVSKYPAAIRNNGGGHYNHSLFWTLMKPSAEKTPTGKLSEAITATFNSFEEFKNKFNDAAKSRFGSGWTWLIINKEKKLEIGSTPNQDNPLMDLCELKGTPVLALDVWEHAYYLKYQNKRADYISAWWNLVNWEKASELFALVK